MEKRDLSPDLNIGITLANLRELGKTPSEIDLLSKCVNGVTYESTFIFKWKVEYHPTRGTIL